MKLKNGMKKITAAALALITSASMLVSASAAVRGDYSGDGKLAINDVTIALRALSGGSKDTKYDMNGDGRFNIADVSYMLTLIATNASASPETQKPDTPADTKPTDGGIIDLNYKGKYYYSLLSDTEKLLYDRIVEAVRKYESTVDLQDIRLLIRQPQRSAMTQRVRDSIEYDNPELFWFRNFVTWTSGDRLIKLDIEYWTTKKEAITLTEKMDAAAQDIIDKAMEKGTEVERVRAVHDEIVNTTSYQSSSRRYVYEAYGPLVNKKAVCEGYTKAFKYILQKMGTEAIMVSGSAGEPHAWNMVKLNNKWYHIDVTWDDPVGGSLVYDYFMLTDAQISKDHTLDKVFTYPKAA